MNMIYEKIQIHLLFDFILRLSIIYLINLYEYAILINILSQAKLTFGNRVRTISLILIPMNLPKITETNQFYDYHQFQFFPNLFSLCFY